MAMARSSLNERLGIATLSVLTFVVGISMRGDWLLVIVGVIKQLPDNISSQFLPPGNKSISSSDEASQSLQAILERCYLKDLPYYLMMAYLSSFGTFWIFGGALYYHYYVRNRDQAENWKCQPDRFLTPENTRHAFTLGSVNMLIGSTVSGLVSSYVSNNGPSKIYYSISDMGWPYFLMSIPIFFLACDGMSYYFHRLFHWPPFYKRIHKVHHRYHQPIIWTATAMHPIELLTLQAALLLPVFVIPIHAGIFIGNLVYSYYYGMIDHSGITMDAIWPWQPSSKFHDDHHKYFHCNIGFNSKLFDWLHGTLVRENRKYGEDVFGCKGAPLEAANHNKSGKPKKIN